MQAAQAYSQMDDSKLVGKTVYLKTGSMWNDSLSGIELTKMSGDPDYHDGKENFKPTAKLKKEMDLRRVKFALDQQVLGIYTKNIKLKEKKKTPRIHGRPLTPEPGRDHHFDEATGKMLSNEANSEAYKHLNRETAKVLDIILSIKNVELLEHMLRLETKGDTDYQTPRAVVVDALNKRLKDNDIGGHTIKKLGSEKVKI